MLSGHHGFGVVVVGAMVAALFLGCSESPGLTAPAVDKAQILSNANLDAFVPADQATSHSLWGHFLVYVNADENSFAVVPLREVSAHWNVLTWLENGPCTNCLRITKMIASGSGTMLIDVQIRHPFPQPKLTGFDVRGIAMFDGSYYFMSSWLTTPDHTRGDGELVNADGYTTLYNWTTEGMGPGGMQGYMQGKFASYWPPDALLNGYKRHISDDPGNTRNAFYAGDSVTVTYEIDMPDDEFVLGYAVDASWAKPDGDEFPPEANCPEPWKVEVTEEKIGDGLTHEGGETKLIIDVYDWQGRDSHSDPVIECWELFSGTYSATWVEDGDGYSRYELIISNENLFPGGACKCLVSVEDNENETAPEWLDLTAYQIRELTVTGPPIASAGAEPNPQSEGDPVHFFDNGSYDPDGGEIVNWEWDWDCDGTYDEPGEDAYHTWASAGTYYVQLRVTDDEGLQAQLVSPVQVEITPEGVPVSPTDITPAYLNHDPYDLWIEGNYAYVASGYNWLQIFDISNPANPVWVRQVNTLGPATDVCVQGNLAYVAAGTAGLRIVDVSSPESAQEIASVEMLCASDVAVTDGYAYVVYQNYGLTIVDIDPPESAYAVKYVEYPGMIGYADDVAVSNGYVYIPCRFDGIYVADVDPMESASIVHIVPVGFGCVHAVQISGDLAYVADANFGLDILDISVPESAYIIKNVDMNGFAHDVALAGSIAYVAADRWGVNIVDITDPDTAHILKEIDTPWFAWGIDYTDGYVYDADLSGGLQVIDVSPIDSAHIVTFVDTPAVASDIAYEDGYAYIAHPVGLKIIDTDPSESAQIVRALTTPGGAEAVDIAGGYAFVGDGYGDLQIIDITPPESAGIVSSVPVGDGEPNNVLVFGGYAYMTLIEEEWPEKKGSIHVINVSSPGSAYLVDSIPTPGMAMDVAVSGGYAYVTVEGGDLVEEDGCVMVIDIDPPTLPKIVHTVEMEGMWPNGIAVSGDFAFVGGDDIGFQIVDISSPESAYIAHSLHFYGETERIDISNGYAYAASGYLKIVDIDPLEEAYVLSDVNTPGTAVGIVVSGEYAYVASGGGGLRILKLW